MSRLLLLLAIPAAAQPSWISIATPASAYQYFRYWSEGATEQGKFDPANPHPARQSPYQYAFSGGGSKQRGVCALEDRPGVYWYTPQGQHLAGTFAISNPTEFNVSTEQRGLHGFAVAAHFAGDARKTGAIEVAYFTTRACSDAGTEYGFSRDLATDSVLVYWSTFSNCGNDATGLCRKTDDPVPGPGFKNIQQENGGTSWEHGVRIYGLRTADEYTYKILVQSGALHVEVSTGGKLARCSTTPNAPLAECSFTRKTGAWFPTGSLTSGYIVTGTQTVGEPEILSQPVFTVSDILVAK